MVLLIVVVGCGDDDDDEKYGYGVAPDAAVDAGGDAAPAREDTAPEPCTDGLKHCGGACVDLSDSRDHCGACGVSCPEWTGTCVEGTCVCNDAEKTYCGDTCVDTSSDRRNCGDCRLECANGDADEREVCHASQCKTLIVRVVELTNEARSTETDCDSNGVMPPADPLRMDPYLNEAAQAHADDMAANVFMEHEGSDGSRPSDRVDRTDYAGGSIGENIARGYRTPEEVLQGWIDSDGHCSNLMNEGWQAMGAGVAESEDGELFWAQVFGSK